MNQSITEAYIENRIFSIREVQVMLDRDLAEMYQVETKVLNQAVKRNLERFPETFRFQLTEKETNELFANSELFGSSKSQNDSRSQIVTLNDKRGQNIKYLPYAYTEQGVAMLSAILRSEVAIKVSIQIMSAFVAMRKVIFSNSVLLQRMNSFERKLIETDLKFERVFKVLEGNNIPSQGVFYDGQVFDAYEFASKIIRSARQSIVLIDNYIDESTFMHLAKKKKGVNVLILTKAGSKQLMLDLQKANEQYGNFILKTFTQSHDRFLIVDDREIYHIGASLKDLGKKWFAFSKMEEGIVSGILKQISKL